MGCRDMGNLKGRVEKLEKAKGVGETSVIMSVAFINPDRTESLTPEEAAAFDDYQEKMTMEAKEGCVVMILRSREKAQELLALAGKN